MNRRFHSFTTVAVLVVAALAYAVNALAQTVVATNDTLHLAKLQTLAVQHDPRARQFELLAAQSALRESNLDATRLPNLAGSIQGQYQSQVIAIPLRLPNGTTLPEPSHEVYDAHVAAQQTIYDPSLGGRRAVERAQLDASGASLRVSLYALRQNVNDAYFAALINQMQVLDQQATIAEIEEHRRVALARVQQGTALSSEPEMLEAELLRRKQAVAALEANRAVALADLGSLTGNTTGPTNTLSIPDLATEVARARGVADTIAARPEFTAFARTRDLITRKEASANAGDLPRISAFGQGGYGRPGLNPLSQDFQGYWLAGVKVDWTPWNWGATARDRQVLTLQKKLVATDEAAFRKSVQRVVASRLTSIDQLKQTLDDDDAIIALREKILQETELRFDEGVITSSEYIDRETDLLNARLARSMHVVQLAQARAGLLTSLGLEVR